MGLLYFYRKTSRLRAFCHDIYVLDDDPKGVPSSQDSAACASLLQLLECFSHQERLDLFRQALGMLRPSCGSDGVSALWLGEYGCVALLFKSLGSAPQECYRIYIVGLDKWDFDVHCSAAVGRQWTSLSENYVELLVGSLPVTMCNAFLAGFKNALADVQAERRGDERSAAGNEQGHQRTPSFVWALMTDVLRDTKARAAASGMDGEEEEEAEVTQPPGALTDVGLHTGGKARNTSWAIVRAAVEAVMLHLGGEGALPADLWPRFDVWFVEHYLTTLDGSEMQAQDVNAAMKVLQTAVRRLASLADNGHDVSILQHRCEVVKSRIVGLVDESAKATAEDFILCDYANDRPHLRDVKIASLPADVAALSSSTSLENARRLALVNLGDIRLPPTDFRVSSAQSLLSWLKAVKQESSEGKQLVLTTVEQWAFAAMQHLHLSTATEGGRRVFGTQDWESHDVDAVAAVMNMHLKTLGALRQAEGGRAAAARLLVELRSRELLVMWVCFCLVHDACKWAYRDMSLSFGVPLRWQDLRHLCLEDREAWETVERVHGYLEANTIPGSELFSLSKPLETMKFAEAFALKDEGMCKMLRDEKKDAQERKVAYWAEVARKQKLAARLRRDISELEGEISDLDTRLSNLESNNRGIGIYGSQGEDRLRREIKQEKERLEEKRDELKAAERAPPAVFQPVPESDHLARRIIFMLTMPERLQVLARLSVMAQQMLLPDDPKVLKQVAVGNPKAYLKDYTTLTAGSKRIKRLSSLPIALASQSSVVPGKVGPTHVDNIVPHNHGIWHPDTLVQDSTVCLLWESQGVPGYLNPFLLQNDKAFSPLISEHFTVQLPAEYEGLQWAMLQPGTQHIKATRGNEALARQDECPPWLDKPQYLAFASLREYPLLQLHKLTCMLLDHSLPLGHPAVRLLLLQTLRHLGDLRPTGGKGCGFVWKREWLDEGATGLQALHVALAKLGDELRNAPRESATLRTVAQVAASASQWHPTTHAEVCRGLVESVQRFAHDLEAQIDAVATQTSLVSQLRAKQCRYYLIGLLCHACHRDEILSQEDAVEMCKLMVQANHARIFEEHTADDDEIRELSIMAQHIMARVINRLILWVDVEPSCLTALAKLVIQDTPSSLTWKRLGPESPCYEAVGGVGLYSINVLTGVVLLNGRPPRRLPASILSDELYQRVFSGRDFETVLGAGGVMRTVRPVDGSFYEFHQAGQERLVITEVTPTASTLAAGDCEEVRLELLDWRGAWCKDLPERLVKLHSHWRWRGKGIILLRGIAFNCRTTSFVLKWLGAEGWRCLSVPTHLQHLGAAAIRQALQTDQAAGFHRLGHLTAHPEVERVLSRLEDKAFIHYYASGPDSLTLATVELPRFGLQYELEDDGRFWSADFGGDFFLPKQQYLTDTLRGFEGYLLLEHRSAGTVKVVIPRGHVTRQQGSGKVSIDATAGGTGEAASRSCDLHYYDVHPRLLHLQSPTISAQLHLACLYAACSTRLAEPRRGMTGAQVALELVRQCFVTRPLNLTDELPSVRLLQAKLSHTCPALTLLATELECSSQQHAPLYADDGPVGPAAHEDATSQLDTSAAIAYLRQDPHLRTSLTPEEEERLLGRRRHSVNRGGRVMPSYGSLVIKEEECGVAFDVVSSYEDKLLNLLRFETPSEAVGDLPLRTDLLTASKLGQHTVERLLKSLDAHQSMPTPHLVHTLQAINAVLCYRAQQVKGERQTVETFVLRAITTLPASDCSSDWHATGYALLRVGELRPLPCLHDLLRLALDVDYVRQLNPFLSQPSCVAVRRLVLLWMSLCVLEDQLQRLFQHCDAQGNAGDEAALKQELQVHRNWDMEKRVEWLVYEVENRLKIRPMQATVAELLVLNLQQQQEGTASTGQVVQMNMGEGKTRVILPLLLLHPKRGDRLMRLHFLSQLLGDAVDHMHAQLCRSVLHRKVGVLPFHRQSCLSPEQIGVLLSSLRHLQRSGGALCLAPEHRLSMALRVLELQQEEEAHLGHSLQHLLDDVDYVDVLDECDELLRHKYQLIYAVGSKEELPSGPLRWHAVQALCRIIKKHGRDTTTPLGRLLAHPQVAIWEGGGVLAEAFPMLRLVKGEALEAVKHRLTRTLAAQLLDDLPYEFRFLATDKMTEHRAQVLRWISDRAATVDEEMEAAVGGEDSQEVQALLVLRGLLAFELLFHVLQMRHRVDYGIKEGGLKRLAVPYRAADTPAERAEYGQADVSLCCTMLSYYDDGLSEAQTLQAFATLLKRGRSEQDDLYQSWLSLSRPSMSDDEAASVDSVLKLDLTNALQRTLLVRNFRRNMETINLFLSHLVLPNETKQFPQRLVANAWHLCDNPIRPIGFSGTDDNNLLLPLQVEPLDTFANEELSHLAATNGRMLCLLEENPEVALLGDDPSAPLWQRVLDEAVRRQVDALIDAGGLVAGVSYAEAASYALRNKCKQRAVVFWDQAKREWAVVDDKGRQWALGSSPIRERDALVLFDDSHCRGADMRLSPDAKALLTLGPRMQKDKLMQAAGRMRRLHNGQTLALLSTQDVARQVRTANGPLTPDTPLTTRHVLQWATGNSVSANREGLAEFAKQGLCFAYTSGDSDEALVPETLELHKLYGKSLAEEPLQDFVQGLKGKWESRQEQPDLSEGMADVVRGLEGHVEEYGGDCRVSTTGLDEECERELEKEVEQEEEREVQVPRMTPRAEVDWPYHKWLNEDRNPYMVPFCGIGGELGDLLAAHVKLNDSGEDLARIKWPSSIYATHNFMLTVEHWNGRTPTSLDDYLRPVFSFLHFKDNSVLLLSGREADAVQAIIYRQDQLEGARTCRLLDLTTCRLARAEPDTFAQLQMRGSHASLPVDELVGLQLFDGDTSFKSAEQKSALKRAIAGPAAPTVAASRGFVSMRMSPRANGDDAERVGGRRAALVLPRLRGKYGNVMRSDLERACT